MSQLGIVAIGRNEGERLRRCLESVVGPGRAVVYVDSGSTDGSVELARRWARRSSSSISRSRSPPPGRATPASRGSAGRARTSSWSSSSTATARWRPAGWTAPRRVRRAARLAVVAGRRRERSSRASIYNRLADLEWDTPIGEAEACGGDALSASRRLPPVGGFDPSLIAGEDDDLCLRMRRPGWKILRIDAEMTVHDMAMTRSRSGGSGACARPRLRRGRGDVRRPRAPLRPPGPQRPLLGAPDRLGLRPGVADPRPEPRPAGRLSAPLCEDRALLPAGPGLARRRRPALRGGLRAGQVPAGRRRGELLAAAVRGGPIRPSNTRGRRPAWRPPTENLSRALVAEKD